MTHHPELAAEQAYVDHAYACLERAREEARRLLDTVDTSPGGTHQGRYEREVLDELVATRLAHLDLDHDYALVFGRIDRHLDQPPDGAGARAVPGDTESQSVPASRRPPDGAGAPSVAEEVGVGAPTGPSNTAPAGPSNTESFHIGRLAVSDENRDPIVVDWRAPVAEPFYRATGRQPMGLARRRHFAVKGRTVLDLEDEVFGEGVEEITGVRGHSTLLAALDQSRTGRLGDIVATIQAEQDDIIRADPAGVLVVQGGPGTGKTVVALHRAAYLLYTYRFPLEGQGVLVVGPNRLFLRYIERVLPSLGEAGVEQVVLADLVPDVTVSGAETPFGARVKGDQRMVEVLAKAVRDRQRPLRQDLLVGFGLERLRLTAADSARIVKQARRRFRRHNHARKFVENEVYAALAASSRNDVSAHAVREQLRHTDIVRATLEAMWPVLTPAELLHDLFGSVALLRLAASRVLTDDEWMALHRPREAHLDDVRWTEADLPLIDEARVVLGGRPARASRPAEDDELRTYGHIVVDEVQDLTPMALRMITRRSLSGNLTVVGDIAQATGPLAPRSWADVLVHLPDRRPSRMRELTVGYRIPAQSMALAARVLRTTEPGLAPPRSVREGDAPPAIVHAAPDRVFDAVISEVETALAEVGDGSVAVVAPTSLVEDAARRLEYAGLQVGRATRSGLDAQVTVIAVGLVKGLELDAVIVLEPGRIVNEEVQGLRSLYVALTRATKRLAIVHAEPMPEALVE